MKKYLFCIVSLSFLAMTACDAKAPCDQAYGTSKESVKRACRRGAEEIAPASHGDIKAADAKCVELYARAETPIGEADSGVTLYDPDRDVRDLYNACHFGATGYMATFEGLDIEALRTAGCEQIGAVGSVRCY